MPAAKKVGKRKGKAWQASRSLPELQAPESGSVWCEDLEEEDLGKMGLLN